MLILSLISLTLANTPWITEQVTGFQEAIAYFLTGTSTPIDDLIDFNIAATALIDLVVQDVTGKGLGNAATLGGSNTLTAGWLGQGGPAVAAASLLLMARVAIVFGIMLSPVFLFFILFEKTNALFWQWVKYLLSIFFAMAALSIVAVIALQAMSQYGFRVFLSMLVNQMDPGTLRAILVSVLTENLSGADASIDVGGGLTRLAMMGAFFTALIAAAPVIVMTYFGAAMHLAAQGMNAMAKPGGGAGAPASNASPSSTALQHTNHEQRLEQGQYGPSAHATSAAPSLTAGNQTLNYQAMQHIGAQQAATAQRFGDGSPAIGQRSVLGMANDTRFQSGLPHSQALPNNSTAAQRGMAKNSTSSHVVSTAQDTCAANPSSATHQATTTLPPDHPEATPVYAVPPPGVRPPGQPLIEVAAREVPRAPQPMPVRPGASQFIKRPEPR